jgi:hypothetical protein
MRNTFLFNDAVSAMQQAARDWEDGLQLLVQGYLPSQLVSKQILGTVLHQVTAVLKEQFPRFVLGHSKTPWYYAHPLARYSAMDTYLLITIRIPLVISGGHFKMYSVESYSVQLNETHDGSTKLDTLTPYLMVSYDGHYYSEVSDEQFSTCSGSRVLSCTVDFVAIKREHLTCASAIFFEEYANAVKLCSVRYLASPVKPQIINIAPGLFYLIGHNAPWNIECGGGTDQVSRSDSKACSTCSVYVPCHCQMHSTLGFYIPSRVQGCVEANSSKVTFMHQVNFAVVALLGNASFLNQLSANALYDASPVFPIPFFKFLHENKTIRLNGAGQIDFKKLAAAVQKGQTEFTAEMSQQPDVFSISPSEPVGNWLLILSVVVLLVAGLSLYTFWTARRLAAAVSVLLVQHGSGVEAKVLRVRQLSANLSLTVMQNEDIIVMDWGRVFYWSLIAAMTYLAVMKLAHHLAVFWGWFVIRKPRVLAELVLELISSEAFLVLSLGQLPCFLVHQMGH